MTYLAPDEMLADYAAGATPPGLSLLLAAHLTRCPEARRRLHALEGVGGALMAEAPPEPMSDTALERALAAIDATPIVTVPAGAGDDDRSPAAPPAGAASPDAGPLPRPLAERLGAPLDRLDWRARLPGIAEHPLEGFPGEQVSLLRGRPGAYLPQHTHRGLEATLVLQGRLRDRGVVYGVGDLAISDESIDHLPEIVGPETCLCLVVLDAPLRFTGRLSRFLNVFMR